MKRLLLLVATLLFSTLALAAVNINTATQAELEALPGIGPVKSKAIIDYRNANGPFKTPEDIMKVKGIKEGEFGKIRNEISVSGATSMPSAPAKSAEKAAPAKPAPSTTSAAKSEPATSAPATKDSGAAKATAPSETKSTAKEEKAKAKEEKAAKAKADKEEKAKAKEEKAAKAKADKEAKAKAKEEKSKSSESAKSDDTTKAKK